MSTNSRSLPERISFPGEEESILSLWASLRAFEKSMELSEGRKPFTFYDGPPFATGLPHHGHVLAGTIKDIVTRFAHQTGHHVERRFGWDCHGLPVEYEINKKLQISSKEEVLSMGIEKYNQECRSIVTRYTKEWESTVKRIGRWIDCENDYKTMEPWYMESVWNVFQTMHKKGLVYRGYKILPYSTGCTTSLSNFEANMDYRDTPDPSVVVTFPLVEDEDVALLAWTTTPWTLPSNLALCVNAAFDYVHFRDVKSGKQYIVCEERLCQVYPKMEKKGYKGGDFEIIKKMKGSDLVGKKYKPLFDCYKDWENAFQVLQDDYVTSQNGTGIVHQAPAFGEDDYRVCQAFKIISKTELPCPIDDNGNFTDKVPLVQGMYVKKADDVICRDLKERGRLLSKTTFVHSYPFCYRSGTPLIYRAMPGWFVNVEKIRDRIVANNQMTYWVPAFVKEKRFHNWLVNGCDWAISRSRFWGTPLPLWVSDDYEEVVCIGSIEELRELSGVQDITDLHRENIDHITIPSKQGKGTLKRVEEVFDCWFESGSMPYAQQHYPFENKEKFEANFPADFIAEGLDQTRGWFYTLMVISTALFDKPPFKNLIVNGLVLAEDGRKMSKSLRNFPDVGDVLNKHGADSLRLYLINSPVVRAEPLKFKEDGLTGVTREIFLPWYNAMRFFAQNAARLEQNSECPEKYNPFVPNAAVAFSSKNVMDSWILAALHGLIKFVREEMKAYRLYTVVPRLVDFINQLTKWYVRLNRKRLKGLAGDEEAFTALSALYEVLYTLTKLMAPFTPFFTEYMYQFLRQFHPDVCNGISKDAKEDAEGVSKSVHFLMIPDFDASRIDLNVEKGMAQLQAVIECGRVVRERRNISLKNPVREVIVVSRDQDSLDTLANLKDYLHDDLNMRDLRFTTEEKAWCTLKAEPNHKVLGKRLGKNFGAVRKAVATLSHEEVTAFLESGSITVAGQELKGDDLAVRREFKGDDKKYAADISNEHNLMVIIDCQEDDNLKLQGTAREFINRVQKMRKKAGLVVEDKIQVYFTESDESKVITSAVKEFTGMVVETIRTTPAPVQLMPSHAVQVITEDHKFPGIDSTLTIHVCRTSIHFASNEQLLTPCNGKIEVVQDVQTFIATMDYNSVKLALLKEKKIDVQLKGEPTITLEYGTHIFLSAKEKVAKDNSAEFKWML